MTNSAVVGLGLLLAISGGIVFLLFDSMASDMTLFDRYYNSDVYDRYQTFSSLGILFGVMGVIFFVVGFALQDQSQKKVQTVVIHQVGLGPQGTANFCSYCGRQLAPGAIWCPGCGRSLQK